MKKQSLMISDKERYGETSPAVAMSPEKEKNRKTAPTITLVGKQVDAFCACALEVGEKGTATVNFIVKAVSAGDKYGSDVPTDKKPKEVVLSLTHAVAQDMPEGDDGDDDDEETESDEEKKAEEKTGEEDDADEPAAEEPKAAKKSVSPKDAALED